MIGMAIGGTMRGFHTNDFNKTGRNGIMTDIGKGMEPGAYRAINPDQNSRGRKSDTKGNRSTNTGLRSSNISNRDNSSKSNARLSSLRRESKDLKFNSRATNNRMREFSNRRVENKDPRVSNHNTLSLKNNMRKEGRITRSRMPKSLRMTFSLIPVG
jgi:hypothetical protein